MVTSEANSLFTNVPLQETIDINLNRIYEQHELATTILRKEMKELLILCTSNACFLFNDILYEQADAMKMGCSLGTVIANIFIIHLKICYVTSRFLKTLY